MFNSQDFIERSDNKQLLRVINELEVVMLVVTRWQLASLKSMEFHHEN